MLILSRIVEGIRIVALLTPVLWGSLLLGAQAGPGVPPGPPDPPGPPAPGRKLHAADLKERLNAVEPVNLTEKQAQQYGKNFLAIAESKQAQGRRFPAGRFAEAADAMLKVCEHQRNLREGHTGPRGLPSQAEIRDHLQHVYFRVRQTDYFSKQVGGKLGGDLSKWAREFYQLAVRAEEKGDLLAADENAKCADEAVRALENLAQAAAPATPGSPLPPPPGAEN